MALAIPCLGFRRVHWCCHLASAGNLTLVQRLKLVLDFGQGLAHLADLPSQVRHPLADHKHVICHVSVDCYQLLTELPEELRLFNVGVKELAVKARDGWALGIGPRGPKGGLGTWVWLPHFLPLVNNIRVI